MFDFVTCPHCEEVTDIGGLIGKHTNDCPRCGHPALTPPVHAPAAAPWLIVDNVDGHSIGYRAIIDADGFTVCNPSPMGEANARLISAAPDLLEALCTALPFVEDHEDSNVYKAGAVARAVREIRAAIEKATA